MYRYLIVACVLIIVFSSQAFAESPTSAANSEDFFSRPLSEQKNAPHNEKVKALMEKGLNNEDAEYYASVDDLVAGLEKSGKVLDLDKVEAVPVEEITADPRGFKKRILAGDPSAIKAGLGSPVTSRGQEDITKFMDRYPKQSKYVIQYPDGSFIEFSQDPGTKSGNDKMVKPSGYDEDLYYTSANCQGGGPGVCNNANAQWTFGNATYWAKAAILNLDYTTILDENDGSWTSIIGNYTPGASSSGFVSYGTPTKNDRLSAKYDDATGTFVTNNHYAEAQIYFTVTVSGSVSGGVNFSFLSLSLSVNAGQSYTQYCMFRLLPDMNGQVNKLAAYYK
ncbi:hypothetical protein [Cohnella panacarvi]|uniref:hypothetical protein n=1 Tax=Cohnella panacarvi TaxID=400776 RepID=UPI00047B7214|nr:hypothetical protein [Cohnella panacarvi]